MISLQMTCSAPPRRTWRAAGQAIKRGVRTGKQHEHRVGGDVAHRSPLFSGGAAIRTSSWGEPIFARVRFSDCALQHAM